MYSPFLALPKSQQHKTKLGVAHPIAWACRFAQLPWLIILGLLDTKSLKEQGEAYLILFSYRLPAASTG